MVACDNQKRALKIQEQNQDRENCNSISDKESC